MSFKKGKAFFFGFFSKLKKLAKYLVRKTKNQCSREQKMFQRAKKMFQKAKKLFQRAKKNVLESDVNIF